jgi:hypothetical protein
MFAGSRPSWRHACDSPMQLGPSGRDWHWKSLRRLLERMQPLRARGRNESARRVISAAISRVLRGTKIVRGNRKPI